MQTGGTVNVAVSNGVYQSNIFGQVVVGVDGAGTYTLNGGTLNTPMLGRGNGTAAFNLGGGTLKAAANTLNVDLPINLTGTGAGTGSIPVANSRSPARSRKRRRRQSWAGIERPGSNSTYAGTGHHRGTGWRVAVSGPAGSTLARALRSQCREQRGLLALFIWPTKLMLPQRRRVLGCRDVAELPAWKTSTPCCWQKLRSLSSRRPPAEKLG